jgi:hypothetical protein
MGQLKEDIEAARRNDFGRRIFESFASEYAASHLNEKSETAKLMKVVNTKIMAVEEAEAKADAVQKLAESKDAEIARMKDAAQRKEVMNELLSPLNREKAEVMGELLESVQTDKLHATFDKYVSAVMEGTTPKKVALNEAKEVTGDKETQAHINGQENKTAEIFDIRRLAGLKI